MESLEDDVGDDSSLSDQSVENVKKKKISMIEISKYLSRKRSERHNTETGQNRTSTSTGKESAKALSYKCALDPSRIATMLESPNATFESTEILSCPSENIGVRSMSVDFPDTDALEDFEAFAFAEILQEAIDSLEVLKHTVDDDSDANERRERIMMRKKGSCAAEDEKKLIFGRDANYGPVVKSISEKLLDDRDLVCNVFQKVACELRESSTYDWLRCEVNAIIENNEKEKHLRINRKIWQDLIKKLHESQKLLADEFEKQKNEYNEEADKLAAEIDTSYCDNRDKLDYIRRWEEAKLEQHNHRLMLHEESLRNEISELEKERKRDAKVSEELQSYGKSAIYSCENEIAEWTERYHEELERRQQEINQLQENIEKMQESLEKTREVQRERQEVVDEYLAEEKRINDEIEYMKTMNEQATIIQSLWRGYMVRHRLGRFDAIFKEAIRLQKTRKKKKPKKAAKKKK